MKGYVDTIYELRRRSDDPFQRLVYKYLLNSLYGKFGEGEEKEGLVINPERPPVCENPDCEPGCNCVQMYRAGVWRVKKRTEVKHAHVPISACITASSRALITRHLQGAHARGGKVYYCDTDSIITTDQLPIGDSLGALKREKEIEKGTFLAAKLYRLFPGPEIKAKGFRSLDSVEFDALSRGDAVTIERMVRLRENFARGHFSPRDSEYVKRTTSHLCPDDLVRLGLDPRRALRPKRAAENDGKTRPWTYDELFDTFGK